MPKRKISSFGNHARTPYVDSFMQRSNMEVMRRVTPVIAGFSLVGLVSTLFPIVIWTERSEFMVWCYRLMFVGMGATNITFGMLSRGPEGHSSGRGRRSWRLLWAYIVLSVAWCLWITISDYAKMGRYFFLLVALFVMFGLFFVPPVSAAVFNAAVYAITLMGLGESGLLSPIQVITLTFYQLIIIAVSMSNYVTRLRVGIAGEQIVAASRHDELTGLLNRRAFDEDARTYVNQQVFVLLADVDEFKFFNDLYGHVRGDELLVRFGRTLTESFGDGRVYRYGGDEFVVVFPGNNEAELRTCVESWRAVFSRHNARDGVGVTCSAGCVNGFAEDEEQVHDLVRIADVLLYRSKENGRDQVTYAQYSDGLLHEAIVHGGARDLPEVQTDPLTGLPDADYFFSHAAEIAPVLLQKRHSVSFVYFNVANLKTYNAKHGFSEGDELLRFVAHTLGEVFPSRLLTRLGDDRFVLMTDDEGLAEAVERACDLVRDLHRDRLYSLRAGIFRYVSADVEVRYACDCARTACESLRGHYDVLYRYYTEQLGQAMERRNRVLERFGAALANGYIQPFYQPIIRSVSDLVCEFEILARWIDPLEGMLSPSDFIPALEEAHLIHRLDLHIVEEVCKNFHRLKDQGFTVCPVSINFSRLDFEACDLVSEVVRILDRYELPHELIRVEITESALGEDSNRVKESVVRFRRHGMQVWMDDFGSGYSSLNVLREYEFDLVKFDMVFLRGMQGNLQRDASAIMLTNLVSMVKELGLQTLIEGVEDVDQLMFLRGISFEKIQGFVFGKPQSFDELCQRLSKWEYMIEEPQKRTYFDLVSKVNLVQPVEAGSSFDPTGVADGVPVAVLEHADGVLRFLEHNAAYTKRLQRLGVEGSLMVEHILNSRSDDIALETWAAIPQLERTDDWVMIQHDPRRSAPCYARCVARVEGSDTFAFLLCAKP